MYTPWEGLDAPARELAGRALGYDASSWNKPGTALIERLPWASLDGAQRDAATALDLDEETWDCYVNHYDGLGPEELAENGVREYRAILEERALLDEERGGGFGMDWDRLTERERRAAQGICYELYLGRRRASPDGVARLKCGGK